MNRKSRAIELRFSHEQLAKINASVQGMIDAFPTEISRRLVSEYAAENRKLPVNTPYPGMWKNEMTPFMVEIMDCFSARSGVEESILIKCSQIGATASMENAIAYIISEAPGPILFASSKEDLLKRWVSKRFNPLIKSCKLEDKIFKQSALKGNRATGNQQFSKEFPGGGLDIVSAQSEDNLRSDTIRYLFLDEAGAFPWSVSGMGDPITIARARTANWGSRKRIHIASTPGVEGECRMLPLYREGDQRRFFVPCPLCGGLFVFRFQSEPNDYYEGVAAAVLKYDTPGGVIKPESIHVECPHCKGRVAEDMRYNAIQLGQWIPTADPTRSGVRSYQIGRLYSLMDTWVRLSQLEMDSQEDPLIQQTFMNHVAGWPFRPTTQKPDIKKIYELRGNYSSGEIPTEKVLFLTAAIDVQLGVAKDPNKPARLEMEICGHGIGYRTWSLQYKVFAGAIEDPFAGAWQKLYEWISSGGMTCRRADGLTQQPRIVFVDSGEANITEPVVFDFCARVRGFIPIKGVGDMKKSVAGKQTDTILDEYGPKDKDLFREHTKYDRTYISIYTAWYKNVLWRALKIPKMTDREQRPRFCEFPRDYPDKYFDMLVAEERRPDGSFWRPESRPNESLDLRIYNMAAADYWLQLNVIAERKAAVRSGAMTTDQAMTIRSMAILQRYTAAMQRTTQQLTKN